MRQGEEEEEFATKISYQKSLCVDRIQKAWNRHIDDILESSYCLTANLGRDTLRTLAALAESEPISRVKPILISCIHQRASKEPHDGQSRAKRLTRVDVLETKDIIEQENRMPRVNQPIRKKRALFDSRAESAPPDSPAAKHARLRRVTFKVRTEASNPLDRLRTSHGYVDLSPEIDRNERAAATSNRLPRLEESDIQPSLPDIFSMDASGSNPGITNDMGIQDEYRSPYAEGDDDMTDHFAPEPLTSDPWRDHSRNNSIHNSNELDPPNDSNPSNFNRESSRSNSTHNSNELDPPKDSNPPNTNRESSRSSSLCDPLSTTPPYSNNINTFSQASSEVTQKIRYSISELSPMDVNQHFTQIMHERCRQFKVDMDFVREMLGNNLTRAQKDLDDAHQPVKLFEIRLQEAKSRRETADHTYQSALSRSQRAGIVYTQHEALKDFGKDFNKDTAFRGDINTLAEQLRSKWTEIEEELEAATEASKLAHTAATEQAKALQELEAAGVPLRLHEKEAKEARDVCKGTLEKMDHRSPGVAELMVRALTGMLPQDVFATERDASADGSDGATAT